MVYVKVEEFALQLAKFKYFSMNLNDLHNTIKEKENISICYEEKLF